MPIITADCLTKAYPVALKDPGWRGTVTHLLRRQYRLIQAVDQISFTIETGEIVGFLGPNGAGKTTTLKMLSGLIHPSSGQVYVAGHVPFRRQSAFLKTMSLVMGQKQQLLWDLPALDSLRINAAVYDLSDRDFQQRLGELSEMLTLREQLRQPVRKLSLGERMKAELLAALLHQPRVLFLDEPTLGLDVNAQAAVRDFLREYNRRYQATILLTSHYMADIAALCERVLLIYQGQLIYDGRLDGLVERFSPYREVQVKLATPLPADKLQTFAELESCDGCSARFLVQRSELTQVVGKLLAQLPVSDLSVTEPPLEEIIARLFAVGSVAEPEG